MKKYQIILRGVNFECINSSGEVENLVFCHTRVIKASTGTEAVKKVVNLVKDDKRLRKKIYKKSTLDPELWPEGILEVHNSSYGNNFIFWPMDKAFENCVLHFKSFEYIKMKLDEKTNKS